MRKLLDYCATHANAMLRYKSRGMVIKAHSDKSYFLESQARSRPGSFLYMVGANKYRNRPNGAIMVISTIMRNVMSLAAESECGALLYHDKEL